VHRVLHDHRVLLRHGHLHGRGKKALGGLSLEAEYRGGQVQGQGRIQARVQPAIKSRVQRCAQGLPRGSRWALWGAGRAQRQSCGAGLTARDSGGR
jgi:hypothetical protein